MNTPWKWSAVEPKAHQRTAMQGTFSDDTSAPDLYIEESEDVRLEPLSHYVWDAFHPVHLYDMINDRYKVLHFLGHGGNGSVWLCRDTKPMFLTKYVAVKIVDANCNLEDYSETDLALKMAELGLDGNKHIAVPTDEFMIRGPNGTHLCLVFPVLGPLITQPMHLINESHALERLREVAGHVVGVMADLHAKQLCHGDLRPQNILFNVSGLDGYSEEKVIELLGTPVLVPILSRSMDPTLIVDHSPSATRDLSTCYHSSPQAPRYLIRPVDWTFVTSTEAGRKLIDDSAVVIDFGSAYRVGKPFEWLTTPHFWVDPQNHIRADVQLGKATDLWSLGVTLFQIRTGWHLFGVSSIDGKVITNRNPFLAEINLVLGKLPEPLWQEWTARDEFFTEEVDKDGRPALRMDLAKKHPREEVAMARWTGRSIYEKLRWGTQFTCGKNWTHENEIGEDEAKVFADLIGKLLAFNPDERLAAEDALTHPWFTRYFSQKFRVG